MRGRLTALNDLSARPHGVERACDDLRGSRPIDVVRNLHLEQLGVSQDDPKLVVQAMKQNAELLIKRRRARPVVRQWRGHVSRVGAGRRHVVRVRFPRACDGRITP